MKTQFGVNRPSKRLLSAALSVFLAFQSPAPVFADNKVAGGDLAEASPVEGFADQVLNLFQQAHVQGGAASVVDTGESLTRTPEFAALVELIRRENKGRLPLVIKVTGPASEQEAVDLSNECLKEMYGDVFKYELQIDNTLPPFPSVKKHEQLAYNFWRGSRTAIMGSLMVVASMAAAVLSPSTGLSPDWMTSLASDISLQNENVRRLLPALAMGSVAAALEAQFAIFGEWWAKQFGRDYPLVFKKVGPIPKSLRERLTSLTAIADQLKIASNATVGRINVSYYILALVNLVYGQTVYITQQLTAIAAGVPHEAFSMLDSFVAGLGSMAFVMASLGMLQIGFAKMKNLNIVSEALRFKIDSIMSKTNGVGRMLNLAHGMEWAGAAVQGAILALVTVPTWHYIRSLSKRADRVGETAQDAETIALADRLEGDIQLQLEAVKKLQADCGDLLVQGRPPAPLLGHNTVPQFLGELSKRLRRQVSRVLGIGGAA